MREIKFRVWETDQKKMNYGKRNDICLPIQNGVPSYWDEGQGWESEYSKDYIPMQFTGLKDKNGKEIYEGDILREFDAEVNLFIVYFAEGIGQWRLECINEDCFFSFDGGDYPDGVDSNRFEVIGNIYENPELLEEQK